MNKHDLQLQGILSKKVSEEGDNDILKYSLESFAREIDYNILKELLTRLIIDQSMLAMRLDALNKELIRSQEMLVEAQKIAMLGRWDAYAGTGKLVWSKSLYEILEVDPSIQESWELFFSRVHPDDLESVTRQYDRMFGLKEKWTLRFRLLMEDGRIKWVLLRGNPTIDSSDRIIHCYGTIQDITEMKNTEEMLEKYSKHLEKLVEEKVREISASQMATIYALIKLAESRDDDTGTHIERTAAFCRLLAEKARDTGKYSDQIDDKFIETIYKASTLHDIGKVGMPDNILLKPGELTEEEFAIMKTHVKIGYETLAKVYHQYKGNEFLKMGMDIALYHHEKWDGSGYIAGISGEEIPLSARIMAISDVYDALRSRRVYKEAYSHEESVEIIRASRGKHFDPELVDVFVSFHNEFRLLFESIK